MQATASPQPATLPNGIFDPYRGHAGPQPYGITGNSEPENRKVKRNLRSIHIFLIVISGTIGLGLFKNSGEVLAIAGPGGGITAFIVVGFGVIMVMEGLAEMITHWPISNGMIEFVSVFIDRELAIVIGIAYASAYSISFSTLIVAAEDLTTFWDWPQAIQKVIFILVVPGALIILNFFGVLYYGNVEAFCGIVKIGLVVTAFVVMTVINKFVIPDDKMPNAFVDQQFRNNTSVANSPVIATLVGFPIATYAYIGVEIVAVTAVEAKTPHTSLRRAARHIAWITTLMYVTSIISYYFNVEWCDPRLPMYQTRAPNPYPCLPANLALTGDHNSSSIVIIATETAKIGHLSEVLNYLLILAVLSAANTALYVSSRTLWGLACHLDPQLYRSDSRFWRTLARLSTTTSVGRVPGWALVISCLAFVWLLPYLLLSTNTTTSTNLEQVMSGAATVLVVLVWASQCLAFIRYRKWLSRYQVNLNGGYTQFDHFTPSPESLKYESNISGFARTIPAWLGLIFCLAMVLVFSTAEWWSGRSDVTDSALAVDILSSYIALVILLFFWLVLKAGRYFRGDDFKWYETVDSWAELREKLDGLSNAIHKQEFDYVPQEAREMVGMSSNLQSQTPLVGGTAEPDYVHSPPAHGDPNALGIHNFPVPQGVSTGVYDPRIYGRSPPQQQYQGMNGSTTTAPDRSWQDGSWQEREPEPEPEPFAGPSRQSPRRRSIRENYRGQFREHY